MLGVAINVRDEDEDENGNYKNEAQDRTPARGQLRHIRHIVILIDQRHQFIQFPNVIGQSRFHRRRDAKCLVSAGEIVVHEVKGDVVVVVLGPY